MKTIYHGQTNERTDGTDENYIPLRHTTYAGAITSVTDHETCNKVQGIVYCGMRVQVEEIANT